ncbi:MAG: response regulator transcription factor [Pseudonocardiaceae bacterium]
MTITATALVVDDEPQMTTIIGFALETQGFSVLGAHDGATALNILRSHTIDLVILDVLMPAMDGLSLCSRIRSGSQVPIMILTALEQYDDVIAGLEHGADDYVTKPFHPREVALRAEGLVRRSRGAVAGATMHVGELRIDPVQRTVLLRGRRIELPFTELRLLAQLSTHRGEPQSWRDLLRAVWGAHDLAGGRDIVKAAVYRLRSRLATVDGGAEYVQTIRGVGYVMPNFPPVGD